jgi:hypothetical protein
VAAAARVIGILRAALLMGVVMRIEAQARWLEGELHSGVSLVAAIGVVQDPFTSGPATTATLRLRQQLGADFAITGELPAARVSLEDGRSGRAIGHPWIGAEHRPARGPQFEAGIRLALWSPTSQEGSLAFAYGQLVDFDRNEAWRTQTWSARAMVHLGRVPVHGVFVTARGGLTGTVHRQGGDGELLLHYGARIGTAHQQWLGWVGLTGQGQVTESEASLAHRTSHQAEAVVGTRGPRWRTQVALKGIVDAPLREAAPVVVELQLAVAW